MNHGSPTPLLLILGLAIVGSIVFGLLWPRITGRSPKNHGRPAPDVQPIRYALGPPDDEPPTPRFGTGVAVHAYQPDPSKRQITISYIKPDENDVEDDDFRCNLAGINHMGLNGEHRQAAIRGLAPGQSLILIRHHDNAHDENAILALTEGGKDVGYLPAHVDGDIAPIMDRKRAVTAVVDEVEEFTSSGGSRLLAVRLTLTTWKRKPKPRKPRAPKPEATRKRKKAADGPPGDTPPRA